MGRTHACAAHLSGCTGKGGVLPEVQRACSHCLQEPRIRSLEVTVCAQTGHGESVGYGAGRLPMGASGSPFVISSSHGVSPFPTSSCRWATDSGPTTPAPFYVLISPLSWAALSLPLAPHPHSSLGGGHAWGRGLPCLPGGALSVI